MLAYECNAVERIPALYRGPPVHEKIKRKFERLGAYLHMCCLPYVQMVTMVQRKLQGVLLK